MPVNHDLARQFAEAHSAGRILVLPTVWDVWSARLAVEAGFTGLTVGSHPVADAIGSADGEQMNFNHYMDITRAIVEAVEVPVSVDVESGYGINPADLLDEVADTGAVGMNIEDTLHLEEGRIRTRAEHAEYIAGVRRAADAQDLQLVINGRTDAIKRGTADFEDPEAEAIERMKLMVEAGARAVYPVGVTEHEQISRLVRAVDVPVNVTVAPGANRPGDLATLESLGVGRVSWGPLWQAEAGELLKESLAQWR